MTIDDIRLLYEYDRWATNRTLHAAASLGPEQFTRDLGGAFPSVRDTLAHIVAGEWNWLTYWTSPTHDDQVIRNLWAQRDVEFKPSLFPNIEAIQQKWAEVERSQTDFVAALTNETLERLLPAKKTHLTLAHLMQHLANHSTYHRGQIALMMRQLGAEPVTTDFHVFLAERASAA